jgi:predicted alpha/beta superfamily hydrolase
LFFLLLLSNSTFARNKSIINSIEEITIDSNVMAEKRTVIVYLPEGYDKSSASYPVLYLTDGEVHTKHTSGTVDYLSRFRLIPEMIVVGIINTDRNRDLRPTLASDKKLEITEGADRFLKFMTDEVIQTIDKGYRTLRYKVLSGTSYGGLFAVNVFLTKPNVFDAIIAISPSLYWDDQAMFHKAQELFSADKAKGTLYLSIAEEQPIMTNTFNSFVSVLEKNPTEDVNWMTKKISDETHNTSVLLGQYYGLRSVFSEWSIPEQIPQNLKQLLSRYKKMSNQLEIQIVLPEDRVNGYGQWLKHLNRIDEAFELFKWNTKAYPSSIMAYETLGLAEEKEGRIHDAKNSFEIALNLSRKSKPSEVGRFELNLKRINDAIRKYQETIIP